MVTLDEAQEILKAGMGAIGYPQALGVIVKAIQEGYKLCKVNEAIEKMTELKEQEDKGIFYYSPPYYTERCIEIIKEAADVCDTEHKNR